MAKNSLQNALLTATVFSLTCGASAQTPWLGPQRAYGFSSPTATSGAPPAALHILVSQPGNCGIAYRQRPVSRVHTAFASPAVRPFGPADSAPPTGEHHSAPSRE